MKIKYCYSFLAGAALVLATACTPDDHDLSAPELTADDLVEGKAYTVSIDQATNKVTMKSLLGNGYITSWIHPQGVEKKLETEANIPFAGDYEIKFGVMTRGGMVYGEPYKFTINTTNGDLLTDPLWDYLTGGADQSKTWVLDRGNLSGFTSFTFCCPPMGWDKFTDGKTFTEADYPTYKDDGYDSPDWTWSSGYADWMFSTDIYNAIPELTFDLINGANVTIDGVTNSFVMDPVRKTLTMPAGVNWLGENMAWKIVDLVNVELVMLNEHVLGIKAIRDDGKGGNGDQRIVFTYVEKGWDGSWPSGGPNLTTAPVVAPSYDNLAEDLFTIVGSDASYLATSTTLLMNEEAPYDYVWWNGTVKDNNGNLTGAWEQAGNYGTPAAPAYNDGDIFKLTLDRIVKDGTTTYKGTLENAENASAVGFNFTIQGNKLVFDKDVTLLNGAVASISGKEFTVVKCSPIDGEIVLGVPAGTDEAGDVNRYLCVNLTVKAIGGGGETGPVVIPVDNTVIEPYLDAGNFNSYRIELYNPWGGADKVWPIDPSKLKMKKRQTLKVAFQLDGVTWANAPRVVLCHNIGAGLWPGADGAAFDDPSAVTLNENGETVATFVNNSGAAATFEGSSCLAICIDQSGNVTSPLDGDGNIDPTQVTVTISSITIE